MQPLVTFTVNMNVRITQRTAFLTLAPSRSTAFNGRKACSNRFTRIARKIQASLDLTEDMERIVSRRYVVTSTLVIGQLTRALPAKAVMVCIERLSLDREHISKSRRE